jgi:two-component system NarL family sensor kinase
MWFLNILGSFSGYTGTLACGRSQPQCDIGRSALPRRAIPAMIAAMAPAPSARSVVARFALGSAAAIAIAVVGGYVALRSVATDEAKRETRTRVQEASQIVESSLAQGLLTRRPAAISAVDDVVVSRVLSSSIVRVKIWSADGHVLYSDDPAQIGGHFTLDDGQLALLRNGGAKVEVTDLKRPENVLDRGQGRLIEAYTRIRTPAGTPLLFEVYQRLGSVDASARRLLRALAPPILGAIALILLIQAPLVGSLVRRLQRGNDEREALLANAVSASARERQRVASYLHDGPVQDIAGLAFGLAPLASSAAARGDGDEARALDATVERLRRTVRDLRTLLVELHPPNLAAVGLPAAIDDLVSPLVANGVAVTVAIDGAEQLDREREALVYRVAQEALRNVIAYADAREVHVELTVADRTRLVVRDDGRGFRPELREQRLAEGHLGLSLVQELARQSGGSLAITSSEGQGTHIELELPPR